MKKLHLLLLIFCFLAPIFSTTLEAGQATANTNDARPVSKTSMNLFIISKPKVLDPGMNKFHAMRHKKAKAQRIEMKNVKCKM